MEELSNWQEVLANSVQVFGDKFMASIPGIIGAILIFILGWIAARIVSAVVAKFMDAVKFNEVANRVEATKFLQASNIHTTPVKVVKKFVYWLIMLLVLVTAADALGWEMVSDEFSKLISYLPKLLMAIVIFIIGVYIATFIRDMIKGTTHSLGISIGKFISTTTFYLLMVIISLTALRQAGFDTTIITSNLLLFIGAILATASISYGFASRQVLSSILAGHFNRRNYQVGMRIKVDDIQGQIVDIHALGIVLQIAEAEKVNIPADLLISKKVHIFK